MCFLVAVALHVCECRKQLKVSYSALDRHHIILPRSRLSHGNRRGEAQLNAGHAFGLLEVHELSKSKQPLQDDQSLLHLLSHELGQQQA